FVREQDAGLVRDCGTDRDALLLASREGSRALVPTPGEPDAREELLGAGAALRRVVAEQAELQRHGRGAGQVGGERGREVLVEQTEGRRSETRGGTRVEPVDVDAADSRGAGGETLEPGQDAQERGLSGSARAEDDDDLTSLDGQIEALERDGSAGC